MQYDLGQLQLHNGDTKGAESSFRHAIAIDPEAAQAHYQLARLLASTGRREEAKVEFAKTKSIHIKENDVPLVNQLPTPQQP